MDKCPSGYFCPSGTFEPRLCDSISVCPEGSVTQRSLVGIVSFLVIDFVLVVLCLVRWRHESVRVKRVANNNIADVKKRENGAIVLSAEEKKDLEQNYIKSMNGHKLKMHFTMENLGFKLPNGKVILDGVSGHIEAGRMTAIMGPSGAGSSSILT
jgi:ABC-type multidrug transport system fused ATPase/permease subunit